MRLHFVYTLKKDVENFIKGTKSINNKQPTKFQISFSEKYGQDFSPTRVAEFIEKINEETNFVPAKEISRIEEKWKTIASIFIERVEKIFDLVYPSPIITVYLTHNERCTYNLEENYFFVKIGSDYNNNIIMHELLHFYTWQAFGKRLLQGGVSKSKYNDIKESLTELLNLEFSDLMNDKPDLGYPQHQELRSEIKKLWLAKHNLKEIINSILKYQ